jgi:2-C-methyl-D-erythritol 2,4-cyclodiphosphate synthase
MFRIGEGYDVHRLSDNRKMIIGGVEIEYEKGLLGHSDADVLLHAISDSLLGAAALGDIGHLFPDTDKKYEGANSLLLLSETVKHLKNNGFSVINIDSTIIAQKPKMAPHIDKMRENIAIAVGIDKSCVSVKATTEENLGFTGEGLGIAAKAIALITDD